MCKKTRSKSNFTITPRKTSIKDNLRCYSFAMLSVEIKNTTFLPLKSKVSRQKIGKRRRESYLIAWNKDSGICNLARKRYFGR